MEPTTSSKTISLPRELVRSWVETQALPDTIDAKGVQLDFTLTENIDSAGVAWVRLMEKNCSLKKIPCSRINLLPQFAMRLPLPGPQFAKPAHAVLSLNLFGQIGEYSAVAANHGFAALVMLSEMFYWGTIGVFHSRTIRRGSFGEQMYQLGYKAIGIVGLLSLLIGVVLALQTAIQLRIYGAGIFLAPMIGISMIRELGPLMTAIILAGRSGSATTAEIATMAVNEELDALQTMGINPMQFVVAPKFWAISITMPLLSIVATITGIIGGFLVAILYLDLGSSLFINELIKNIFIKDVFAGFLKSIVFSWIIIWIGAYYGFTAKGGAEEVGKQTTASVVACIFMIIIADAIFSFII